jgi:hypothetical protein
MGARFQWRERFVQHQNPKDDALLVRRLACAQPNPKDLGFKCAAGLTATGRTENWLLLKTGTH